MLTLTAYFHLFCVDESMLWCLEPFQLCIDTKRKNCLKMFNFNPAKLKSTGFSTCFQGQLVQWGQWDKTKRNSASEQKTGLWVQLQALADLPVRSRSHLQFFSSTVTHYSCRVLFSLQVKKYIYIIMLNNSNESQSNFIYRALQKNNTADQSAFLLKDNIKI